MKLTGKIFKYPMAINEVVIKGNAVMFHNHNETGSGYIYGRKLKEDTGEEVSIALNEKDFKLISTLESFDMTVKDSIKIKAGKIKLTCANLVDFKKININLKDMKPLSIDLNDLKEAVRYTGTDPLKIQALGINVFKNKIVSSDSVILYENLKDTGVTSTLNIPKEAIKYLPKDEEIKITYKEGLVDFVFNGTHYYTNLISQHINESVKTKKEFTNKFKISKSQFIEDLQLIKQYDKFVDIDITNKSIKLTGKTEIEDITIEEKITSVEHKRDLCKLFNVQKLIDMVSIVDSVDVEIAIHEEEKTFYVYVENKNASCMLMGSSGRPQ